jgi:hypothetical protein
MRAFVFAATLVAGIVVACSALTGTRCSTAADCSDSDESRRAGRCGPEIACSRDGYCHAECLGTCTGIATESRFPQPQCENGGVCNQPIRSRGSTFDAFRCTRRRISCATTDDCPIHEPHPDGEWTCESGACRFPGHEWAFD